MAGIWRFQEPLRATLKHMVRNGPLPVDQFAEHLEVDLDAKQISLHNDYWKNGYLEKVAKIVDETNQTVEHGPIYRVALALLADRFRTISSRG